MELKQNLKLKLTERFLRKVDVSIRNEIDDVVLDLLNGEHNVVIATTGKYTISDIAYTKNGYEHHFIGVSSKNPCDADDDYYGIKVATEKALLSLISKFYIAEFGLEYIL